jgi:Secretion system C-terminal sorting domain
VAGNLLSYTLSFHPLTVSYDDSARTLSTGNMIQVSTLGLKVLSFTAGRSINGNEINLSVIKDQQIEKVLLFRSSNGNDYIETGPMILKGNYNQSANYYYNDKNVSYTTCFYKAKIISSGNDEFTNVVKIQSPGNMVMAITPNPADNYVKVSFKTNNSQKTTLHLINSAGTLLTRSSTNNDYLDLYPGNLSNGIYEVQLIQNNETVQTGKLIIHH